MKLALIVTLACTLVLPHAALAAPSPDDLVRSGEQAYQDGRYREAADAFARAYELEPDPAYLYAQAQALRLAGDCRTATTLYSKFLETDPPEQAERTARDNMAACAEQLAAQPDEPEPAPEPAPKPQPETAPPVDREPEPAPRAWYRDPWGGVLVGVGLAGLAVGGGLYGQAVTEERAADQAEAEPEYGERIERASTLSRAGIGVLAVGSAVLVAGVIRWAVLAAKQRKRPAAAARARWLGSSVRVTF